jgi:hypothetical protein
VLVLTGAHVVVYSKNAEADRVFFRDILGLRSADAGHGWLIFAVPAAEMAFHPHDQNNKHEMFFTCDDLNVQVAALQKKGVQVDFRGAVGVSSEKISSKLWKSPLRTDRSTMEGLGLPILYISSSVKERP